MLCPGGGARLGVGSVPTCLCTCARLSEDILSSAAAVQPEQKVVSAARVGVVADEFMFYSKLRWILK